MKLLGALLGLALSAAEPASYSRRVWQAADGLPEDLVQAIAQTPDGYLWLGTSGGLVRFDGIRFTIFDHSNSPQFRDDSIYALVASRDGALWIGTEGGGLIRYNDGRFKRFGPAEGLTNGFVRAIYEDSNRTLWIGTDRGLFKRAGEQFRRIDGSGGIASMSVHSICEDRSGRLLVGGLGLLILHGGSTAYFTSAESLADNSIRSIHVASDGSVSLISVAGLRRLAPGFTSNPFKTPRLSTGVNVATLLETRTGQLWAGTHGQGVMQLRDGRLIRLAASRALPENNVLALFEDAERNIWVGTQGGLLRLSPGVAATLEARGSATQSMSTIYADPSGGFLVAVLDGKPYRRFGDALDPFPLPASIAGLSIRNVFRDRSGILWMGTNGQGAVRFGPSGPVRYTMRDGLVNDFTRAFAQDNEGGIWIGTDSGLSRFDGRGFRNFNVKDGLAYGSVRAVLPSRDGSLWIGTDGGLSRFRGTAIRSDPLLGRLNGVKVWSLCEDVNGSLWIGTYGSGLFHLKQGRLTNINARNGLPSDRIQFLARDRYDRLWMSSPIGVFSSATQDLEAAVESPSSPLAVRLFGTAEGMDTNRLNGGVQPAGALTATGELWLPSMRGAVRIATGTAPGPDVPLPVIIEDALADDRHLPVSTNLTVAPGRSKLEIRYTAIRLRSPERVRFRYLLEGFDPAWNDAGARRVAYYTNVPPGDYRFHVVAYELGAPGTSAERSLQIRWRPRFHQTPWFIFLCVLAGLAAVWGAYRLRLRNLRARFAAVLQERNRLAREMHDTLIQGCVGVSTLLEAASSAQTVSPGISRELLDKARDRVRATVDEARLAVWNLRHEDRGLGLASAVSQLAERMERETGIPVLCEVSRLPASIDVEAERSLFLVVREAVQNAVRHASPRQLFIFLGYDSDGLQLAIEDDGSGFDPTAALAGATSHCGLIGMRERIEELGGRFSLTSAPGRGTQIHATIPSI